MIIEYKSVYSNQVTMADMIVLFVALVNVGKFFFLAVNPYFNQVVFSRSLPARILPLKKKKSPYSNQVKILSIQSSFLWQLLLSLIHI